MIGIYKITNKINNKAYIGLSIDIEHRKKTHFKRAYNKNDKEYDKALYRAIRKYGTENFVFEILEECKKEELYNKEKFYIKKFNSFYNGYNETPGGEGVVINEGEKHPNHKLTEKDVIDIRKRYANLELKNNVRKIYEDKISYSGFNKIWQGITWKHIMPEVYTEENIYKHKIEQNKIERNKIIKGKPGRMKLTKEEVIDIRIKFKNNIPIKNIWEEYYKDKVSLATIRDICYNRTWKNIIV